MKRSYLMIVIILCINGCSWGIKLDERGRNVRVAWNENVSECKKLGEVAVSVADKISVYERNELKVQDELEVLARNEAARMDADTIAPQGKPNNGEQRFNVFACGNRHQPSTPRADETTKTYPLNEG